MPTLIKVSVAVVASNLIILALQVPATTQNNCHPSYPDVCIPSPPPDLDCKDIKHRNFKVVGSDPHRFDGDQDGIGCEKR